ncbi:MAG: thiamine diphosphokinase [Anaerolineales bacterium]
MQALIVANGELDPPRDLGQRLASADLIIAADGGAQHCRALGILPQVIIGDLDSLDAKLRADFERQGVRILTHPADKDQTDLELALLHAKDAGAQQIVVLAGLGHRWDHSVANLLLAAHAQFADQRIVFLQGEHRLFVIRQGSPLAARVGERVSLLSLGGDAKGVSTCGLKFPLANETLVFGSSRGVSNVVLAEDAAVELKEGCLLCVISPATD